MHKDSTTYRILTLMSKSRVGFTRPELWEKMKRDYDKDQQALAVYLCKLVREGKLRTDGHRECAGCLREHVVYRIADKGRHILWENS